MIHPTFSPPSPGTVDPSLSLTDSHTASQVDQTQTSHPATALQTWKELLANGTEPGQEGAVFISNTVFAASALPRPRLDHEWMGKQEGKLSENGDALLRAFVMAFKHGSPEVGNTFTTQEKANAFKISFTYEGQQYNAQCRVESGGNISDIEIVDTQTPPSKLSLTREGDVRKGDRVYFSRKRSIENSMQRELQAEAKRLRSMQNPSLLSPDSKSTAEFQEANIASASKSENNPLTDQPVIGPESTPGNRPVFHEHPTAPTVGSAGAENEVIHLTNELQVSDVSPTALPTKKLEEIPAKTLIANGDPSHTLKIAYITHHPVTFLPARLLEQSMSKTLKAREDIGSATFSRFKLPSGEGEIDSEQIKNILKNYQLVMLEGNLGNNGQDKFPYKKDWFEKSSAKVMFFDGSGKYDSVNTEIKNLESVLGEQLLSKTGSYTHQNLPQAFNSKGEDAWSTILAASASASASAPSVEKGGTVAQN